MFSHRRYMNIAVQGLYHRQTSANDYCRYKSDKRLFGCRRSKRRFRITYIESRGPSTSRAVSAPAISAPAPKVVELPTPLRGLQAAFSSTGTQLIIGNVIQFDDSRFYHWAEKSALIIESWREHILEVI